MLALLFFLIPSLSAAEIDLAPIVREGTPGDALMQDPVTPAYPAPAMPASGSGTLQKSLSDSLALPVVSTATPGANVQFRGLGRSAEDTDVQAYGVPLNPPQGGGFDLSIFPQFLWSSYEFQPGPALGTFDPRGTAGSLTLVPWTAAALAAGAVGSGRVAGLAATSNLFQVSAAASDGRHVAVVAGSSSGTAQGPSLALSARTAVSGGETVSFHLLMTDLDAAVPGSVSLPTPLARQQTVRGIPILQIDSRIGSEALLKDSFYIDDEYLKYDDPGSRYFSVSRDHIFQAGTENALVWGNWKLGASLRGVQYSTLGSPDQSEAVAHLLVSRGLELGPLLVEPTLRAVGVSRYGVEPEASLGARGPLASGVDWFARAGLSRHFPSLVNRFYVFPGFAANPDLRAEKDWTATLGAELKTRWIQATLEAYGQLAQDAQVQATLPTGDLTVVNLGDARIGSLLGRVGVSALPWLDLILNGTLTASQLTYNGLGFPGQPWGLGVFGVGVHSFEELAGGMRVWELRGFERVSSSALADASGAQLPAYHEEDLEARVRWSGGDWLAMARLEDLTDQRPELVKGYPSYGRTFSVLVQRGF